MIDFEIYNGFIYIRFRSNSISALNQGDTDSIGKRVIFHFKPQLFVITCMFHNFSTTAKINTGT